MEFNALVTKLNGLTTEKELTTAYKALRQDPVIWQGFVLLKEDARLVNALEKQKKPLNAGTLGLFSLDPDFDFSLLPPARLPQPMLEKVMLGYEEYLESETEINSLDQAALIALALIEKAHSGESWKNIFLEISSRLKKSAGKDLFHFWSSILVIALHLVDDQENFLREFTSIPQAEAEVHVLDHLVLCLPVMDEKKIDLLAELLFPFSPQLQMESLKDLNRTASDELVTNIASKLLNKYKDLDVSIQPASEYWAHPLENTSAALELQAVGEIASFAGSLELAAGLNNKALSILSALLKMGKVRKTGLRRKVEGDLADDSLFSPEEISDPDIQRELMFTDPPDLEAGIPADQPLLFVTRARKLLATGDKDKAKEEIQQGFQLLSQQDLENLFVTGPDLIGTYNPAESVELFLKANAFEEAGRLAEILLTRNPSHPVLNLAVAKAEEARGNIGAALPCWEALHTLEPENIDYQQNLADAYSANGEYEKAFSVLDNLYKDLNQTSETDLVTFAKTAIQAGKYENAHEIAGVLLARNPEDRNGLSLSGISCKRNHKPRLAEQYFRKLISLSSTEIEPWLELAEMQWEEGNQEKALTTLREAIAANPTNLELQKAYCRDLMKTGAVSEAYPILQELHQHENDVEMDILLIDAMDILGMEAVNETLETLVDRYPQDLRFKGDYAQRLIWKGEFEKGLHIFENLPDRESWKIPWRLAYAEALLHPDYHPLVPEGGVLEPERKEILSLLEKSVVDFPGDTRIQLLLGEQLLTSGQEERARKLFEELIQVETSHPVIKAARLLTDLALATSLTGDNQQGMAFLEQAMKAEPGWFGLQRIKAEMLSRVGDFEESAKQVFFAIEIAPDDAKNRVWAVDLLQDCGKQAEGTHLLESSIEKYPEDLGLQIRFAEQKTLDGEKLLDPRLIETIEALIQHSEKPNELMKAAIVCAAMENRALTLKCLERAESLGSVEAALARAGIYRINGDFSRSKDVLEQSNIPPQWTRLLMAEMTSEEDKDLEEQIEQLASLETEKEVLFSDVFLPVQWKQLITSTKPGLCLAVILALRTGNAGSLMDQVKDWVEAEPTSAEARCNAIEVALGAGDLDAYRRFETDFSTIQKGVLSNQLELLKSEYLFDTGVSLLGETDEAILFEAFSVEEPQRILHIRELLQNGYRTKAESLFEMAMSVFGNISELPLLCQIGIKRNLAKCALDLERWDEAVQIVEEAYDLAPGHHGMQVLLLKVNVYALEQQKRAEGLDVEKHILSRAVRIPEALQATKELEPFRHWWLRLNLVKEPSREAVRALAQQPPCAEDAAALMAGLRSIDQFNAALQIGKKWSTNAPVIWELAILESNHDVEMAEKYLQEYLTLVPAQALAWRMAAQLQIKKDKLEDAVHSMEYALELWPNETSWHLMAADLWQHLGNLDRPLEHLKIANAFAPDKNPIREKLGNAFLENCQPEKALPFLLQSVEAEPDSYATWAKIASAYQLTGDLDKALIAAEKATALNPTSVKAHLEAGKISRAKGEFPKALEQAKLAISLDPEDAANYVFLAKLLVEQGDSTSALEMLEKASTCAADSVTTMVEHANLVKTINGSIAARDLIESFSKKYPQNADLLVLLAEAESQIGQIKSAEEAAKKALELRPRDLDAHMLLGKLEEKRGNLDQAAQYYSQAIAIEPGKFEGYLQLSHIFINQREYTKAREVMEKGIEQVPPHVQMFLACADLYKEVRNYQDAEKMLRKASILEPKNVQIQRQLGAVLALNMVHQSQEVSSRI